jgi:hypothetical protein
MRDTADCTADGDEVPTIMLFTIFPDGASPEQLLAFVRLKQHSFKKGWTAGVDALATKLYAKLT